MIVSTHRNTFFIILIVKTACDIDFPVSFSAILNPDFKPKSSKPS